jgi:hypothetical protein
LLPIVATPMSDMPIETKAILHMLDQADL